MMPNHLSNTIIELICRKHGLKMYFEAFLSKSAARVQKARSLTSKPRPGSFALLCASSCFNLPTRMSPIGVFEFAVYHTPYMTSNCKDGPQDLS